MSFRSFAARERPRVDAALERLLPSDSGPAATVAKAMRYAVLSGGKRLRPLLVLAAGEACGGQTDRIIEPAAAVELLHTYSLVHDDLPSMDDDDLRRGRPTLHRQFDEAVAILAGDALQALAFEILTRWPEGHAAAEQRAEAAGILAHAVGLGGMVGGQIADLEAERHAPDSERLQWIHRHKTGALLGASAEIGALHGGAEETPRRALARYGRRLGLAFQVADDILDCTGTATDLGKTPGKDHRTGKATYPAAFGIDESRRRAAALVQDALRVLSRAGIRSALLEELAHYAIERRR